MQDDKAILEQLNVQIGIAETNGDLKWLVDVIASEFACCGVPEQGF